MNDREFLIEELDKLQKEIKRLKRENKNTIKMKINFNESIYEVDTQIPINLKEMSYYYLADNYKNPTKVEFIEYEIAPSVDNQIVICARVLNTVNNELEYYHPKNLYNTVNKASDIYLMRINNVIQ